MFKFLQKTKFSSYRSLARFSTVPEWANFNPYVVKQDVHQMKNLISGEWVNAPKTQNIIDPLHGHDFYTVPLIEGNQVQEVINNQKQVKKSGVHNPLKNPHRYQMWGDIFFRISEEMRKPDVENYLVELTQRCMPKSTAQVRGEVVVTRKFFENFTGDNCRFLLRGFIQAGDHDGQQSTGYRWPYGPVGVITPFNFPIEIPALQLFGALLAGNRPTYKADNRMSLVMEQFFRLAIHCGMDPKELDFITCENPVINDLVKSNLFRVTQFTGSSTVAEHLCNITNGKVKIEDAGFDWKIFGSDVVDFDYAVWQSDQDAYAATGQKCSAQSMVFLHKNWADAGFIEAIKKLAEQRSVSNLTIGPVISWNNEQLQNHVNKVLEIPGAKLLFGGKPVSEPHNIPSCYGSFLPTAIYVPLEQIKNHYELVTTEVFAPFQIITQYETEAEVDIILEHMENMTNHLTAAVVSNDVRFKQKILANTVNGTTYSGSRARTTGAPQNHWFGPGGDPRGAGIGSPEAIELVWTYHREIVSDVGPISDGWKGGPQS